MGSLGAALILVILNVYDVVSRRLPNVWVAAYSCLFLLQAYSVEMSAPQFGWHLATAVLTLAITFVLFALGWLGGGDVKLWSAVMLWAGPALALPALVIGTVSGGVLAMICWLSQKLLPRFQHGPLRRPLWLLSAERGVPYGVALSIAGWFVLYAGR